MHILNQILCIKFAFAYLMKKFICLKLCWEKGCGNCIGNLWVRSKRGNYKGLKKEGMWNLVNIDGERNDCFVIV
jgi:hypothetical protein